MLSGNQSISTYTPPNVAIWMTLAFQGGVLNVGGYLACHGFVSHVTGYATLFGLRLDAGDHVAALLTLMVPGFFLLGAMVSGFLVDLQMRLRKKPRYDTIFGLMLLEMLVVVIGGFNHLFGEFGTEVLVRADYVLLALLCLVCGTQNGLITVVSRSVVRTTHLTGITTDLGIGLVRVMGGGRISEERREESRANWMRIGIISFFILGSALGAKIFTHFGYRGFLLPTLISGGLFALTFYFQRLRSTT